MTHSCMRVEHDNDTDDNDDDHDIMMMIMTTHSYMRVEHAASSQELSCYLVHQLPIAKNRYKK